MMPRTTESRREPRGGVRLSRTSFLASCQSLPLPSPLALAAGATSKRGPVRGATHDYHVKPLRDQERALVEHAERAYEVMIAHWQPQRPTMSD